MKQTKCHECRRLNGHHWPTCVTRGYAAIGPHPDAPPVEPSRPPAVTEQEMCCGGTCVRALCPYHGGEPKAAPVVGFTGREVTACGNYVRTFRDGKIVDEEPFEAYTIDIDATVALVCAHLKSQGLLFESCTVEVTGGDAASNRIDMRVTLTGAIENVVVNGSIEL